MVYNYIRSKQSEANIFESFLKSTRLYNAIKCNTIWLRDWKEAEWRRARERGREREGKMAFRGRVI